MAGFYPPVPRGGSDWDWVRKIAEKVNQMLGGKINVTLPVTLRASQTTTTVTDSRIGSQSVICPAMATTADGKAAIVAGIYVTSILQGSCVLNHASNAAADQNITLLIIG